MPDRITLSAERPTLEDLERKWAREKARNVRLSRELAAARAKLHTLQREIHAAVDKSEKVSQRHAI